MYIKEEGDLSIVLDDDKDYLQIDGIGSPQTIPIQTIALCLGVERVRGGLPYLIFVIFFTRAKFLENKIYIKKCQFFALNL